MRLKIGGFEFEMDEALFLVMVMAIGLFVTIAVIAIAQGGC